MYVLYEWIYCELTYEWMNYECKSQWKWWLTIIVASNSSSETETKRLVKNCRTTERFSLEFVFMMDKSRKKKMDGKMQVLQDARHSLDKQNELSYHAPKSQPLIWWTCGPTSQEMEMCQKLVNKEVDEMNDLWKMERQWKIIVHYQNQEKYKN